MTLVRIKGDGSEETGGRKWVGGMRGRRWRRWKGDKVRSGVKVDESRRCREMEGRKGEHKYHIEPTYNAILTP